MKAVRYGFVGLGHLGAALAGSLRRAGFELVVHDLHRDAAGPLLAAGAVWAGDPQAVAEQVDAVITCLPSPAASEHVLAGPRGLLAGMRPGASWIEMSTNGEEEVLRLAALAQAGGVSMLECPVTGGVHLAATGAVTVIVGGEAALFERHRPALAAMGSRIFHVGPLGKAAVIKVITNMLAFIHLIATGEALMLAKQGGIDLAQAYHVIAASSGTSFVHETEGQLILNGSYDINFTMDLALKDLGFAHEIARRHGVPLDLAERALRQFEQGRAAYGGAAQSTRIVQLLEAAVGTDLRAPGFPAAL